MRDILPMLLIVVATVVMILGVGGTISRGIHEGRLLENSAEKKEFIIDKVILRCEIVKDLR